MERPATPSGDGIVVVDRLPLFRHGMCRALTAAGLAVSGEARAAGEGATLARSKDAAVIVLGDSAVGETLEVVSATKATGTRVVLMLAKADRDDILALLGAGVDGLVLRSASPSELVSSVRAVLAGERAIGPAFVPLLVGFGADAEADSDRLGLTPKEREVLLRLAEGSSNQQIAAALYVTPATVKTHLSHIYAKLGANSRQEALTRALAMGIFG